MAVQPIDFMGQNIYNGYDIRMGADGKKDSEFWYQKAMETNGGILSMNNADANKEILFMKPVFKQAIWGGNKLGSKWGYEIPGDNTGEGSE